jgi:BASS family bile acid:Na+ symporter
MTSQLLANVILPVALAFLMWVLGLAARPADFQRLVRFPTVIGLALCLQFLLLPLLAWLVIALWDLPVTLAAGLIILSVCPSGVTSNVITYLGRGDVALSVTLTAIGSIVAPLSIPLLLNLQLPWLGLQVTEFSLPLLPTIGRLTLITVLPLLFGMLIRRRIPAFAERWEPRLRRLSLPAFAALVVLLAVVNRDELPGLWSTAAAACVSLCTLAMLAGAGVARMRGYSPAWQRTFAVEVGIQNAGTGMLVAAVLMGHPEFAITPLFYGVLMNLPALILIAHQLRPLRVPGTRR